MDEQTLGDLVDRLGPEPADVDRLVDELSDHGAADIRDFADHLARSLHALDTTHTGADAAAWGGSWLYPHMGTTDEGSAPQDYMIALRHVALTLDADPAWRTWWG